MKTLLTVIIGLVFYRLYRDKLMLFSSESRYRQLIICILLFITWIINLYYNWNYFKEYDGPKSTDYYIALSISYISGYGFLSVITIYICSLISNAKRSNKVY